MRCASRFLGVGEPGRRPVLPDARRRVPARGGRRARRRRRAAGRRWRTCGSPTAALPGARATGWRGGRRRARARRPRGPRAARRGQELSRPRAPARGRLRARRPTPSSCPADHEQVAAVLPPAPRPGWRSCRSAAARASSAAWSRCAGASPAVVALDLRGLDRVAGVDRRSLTARARARAGRLPEARPALDAQGLTLGHFPQSYEWATIGGCVATRSAGQASTGYGRIDELVSRCAARARQATSPRSPRPRAPPGPTCASCVVGSEGDARGHHRRPRCASGRRRGRARYEGWFLRDVRGGRRGAPRARAERAQRPTSRGCPTRTETRMSLALAGRGGLKAPRRRRRPARARLRRRLPGDPRLGGRRRTMWRRRAPAPRRWRAARAGCRSAARPGEAWAPGASPGPYLRDDLLDRGVMVETLETAATWTALLGLHAAVRGALPTRCARGTPRSSCATSRTSTRRAPRSTSRSGRQDAETRAPSGPRRSAAAGDAIAAAARRSPTTTRRARPRAVDARPRTAPLGARALRAVKDGARPRRDHEPRENCCRL